MHPDFLDPPNSFRPRPFWFWNCPLDRARVRSQVAAMAAGGCGGFFLSPRQGMEVPYLSSAFFDLVRCAVEAAAEHGLEAWLYDEFPYPSGNAAGLVTCDPSLRARELKKKQTDAVGPVKLDLPLGVLRLALALPLVKGRPQWNKAIDLRHQVGVVYGVDEYWRWRLDGCPYNEERYLVSSPQLRLAWNPPAAGTWRIVTAVERERHGFKYYDQLVDTLAPGAAEAFLACTHERYRDAIGEHFGRTVPGIFSDEVEASHWSPHLLPGLIAQGFVPDHDLASLLCDDHPCADLWRSRARRLALELFHQRWERPVADWCERHRLKWVAEKPVGAPGRFLASTIVGIDAGHVRADRLPPALPAMLRANPRAAYAAAASRGSSEVVVECFHSLGWGARLLDQRWGFSWLGVQGASRFTPHAFYASTAGLRKHDAPPSFFLGTPAWDRWKVLGDDTGRWSWLLSHGVEPCEAAVLYPTTSLACAGSAVAQEGFAAVLAEAQATQRLVHPVDGALLENEKGLRWGSMYYPCLIVPSMTVAGPDEDHGIRSASAAGVPVLLIEPLPSRAVEYVEPSAWLALPGVRVVRNPWPLLPTPVLRCVNAETGLGPVPGVLATLRRTGDGRNMVLLANADGQRRHVQVVVTGANGPWSAWSCEDGRGVALDEEPPVVFLEPWGRTVLAQGIDAPVTSPVSAALPLPLDEWELEPVQASWLRLGRWQIATGTAKPPADAPAHEVRPLRWLDANRWEWHRLANPADPVAGGAVTYAVSLHCAIAVNGCELVVEHGAVMAERWHAELDGQPVADVLRPVPWLGGDRRALVLPPMEAGEHRLVMRMEGVPEYGGLTTAVHLHGCFGVDADGRLVELPRTAPLLDPHPPGLAFHFEPLTWTRKWDPGISTAVTLPEDFREVADLEVDGFVLGTRAWPPYRWNLPPGAGPRCFRLTVRGTLQPFLTGQRWDDTHGRAEPFQSH